MLTRNNPKYSAIPRYKTAMKGNPVGRNTANETDVNVSTETSAEDGGDCARIITGREGGE